MIKNERQYRLTKAQLRTFEKSIAEVPSMGTPSDVEEGLIDFAVEALRCQHEELVAEVEEYEALQRGEVTTFVADSLAEVPRLLIKARIALGLNHRDLAARLGVKEQQVQRWEASDYESATIDTLKQVIAALGVETRDELFVPSERVTPQVFVRNLTAAGIPRDFLFSRLLSPALSAALSKGSAASTSFREILDGAESVSRIFRTRVVDLIKGEVQPLSFAGMASTRFKLPARGRTEALNAYTMYAHYLATIVESCSRREHSLELPTDWHMFHTELSSKGSPMTFSSTLKYLWERNVVVLPLKDEGAFHGAVWKIRGRFVIVIKQNTPLESRCLYDLLHEVGHIVNGHVTDDVAMVEDQPISPDSTGDDEDTANEWAEDAIFDGDSDEIAKACVRAAAGRMQRLTRVVPEVAKEYNVNVGALANFMAFRVAQQGFNWWGAAQNLQNDSAAPFAVARDELFRQVHLRKLNAFDRDLLLRALTDD